MRILLRNDDGTEHDITEATQIMYDALHGSMDFGSGFLDLSEVNQMRRIANLAGWAQLEYALDVCRNCPHKREQHWGSGCVGSGRKDKEPRCRCPGFVAAEKQPTINALRYLNAEAREEELSTWDRHCSVLTYLMEEDVFQEWRGDDGWVTVQP